MKMTQQTKSIELDGIEYTYIFTGGLIRIISPEGLSFSDEFKIISRIHFESYMNAVNEQVAE